ncbi:MAG: FAD-dependent oxidoreductase [Candidatus Bathyarchaeia archaeon]
MEQLYDVIVVGGGPAGLTAGMYTARHGLKTLILDGKRHGGRASEAALIDNFPGFPEGISGKELMERFIAHTRRFNAELKIDKIIGLNLHGQPKEVYAREGVYRARAIVIATGIQRRRLKVPGEEEFKGRGVSYCTICDGPLFEGKVIAVVGSSKEAVEDTLALSKIARMIYLIPGAEGLDKETSGELAVNPNIEIIEGSVESIGGSDIVTHIWIKGETRRRLEVDGIFILLDHIPMMDMLREAGVEMDERGCIMVDGHNQTNISGVFAAGECTCGGGIQVITAAGDGARAGISVIRYLQTQRGRG